MKNIITLVSLVLLPLLSPAQSEFEKYEDSEDIGVISINPGLFDMVADLSAENKDEEFEEFATLVSNIDEMQVYVANKDTASEELKKSFQKQVTKSSLDQLIKIKDGDSNVSVYVKSSKNDEIVTEFLMLVSGVDEKEAFETMVFSMAGEIEMSKIGEVINKLNSSRKTKKGK